jgi:hypothetical protein
MAPVIVLLIVGIRMHKSCRWGLLGADYPIAAELPRLSTTSPNRVRPVPMRQ